MNDTTSIPDASIPDTSPSDQVIPDMPALNHGGSPDTVTAFEQLPLDDTLRRGIKEAGFVTPRPVQAATIPSALEGFDVLGLAQTGTGKTAAFVLPILQRIVTDPRRGPRALILAPTRELAMQIQAETRLLAKYTKAKVITVFGGVSAGTQIRGLKAKPDIIVACPGRLLDLFGRGFVDLSHVETLVIDEADHMFDMGFLPDIRKIIAALPDDRQNLMFSATMPSAIRKLANTVLYKPEVFELEHAAPIETIEHALYPVAATRKVDLLLHLLTGNDFKSGIVFSRTKHRAKKLAEQLTNKGHEAVALQGNMTQGQRDRAMKGFREGRFNVLVATDIAARGIDVAGISHVINFDIPNTPDAYTHRIGRTGRAECSGKAYTFVAREDAQQVKSIERKLGVKIQRRVVEGFETQADDEKRYVHAQRNGKHNSSGGGPSKSTHPQRHGRDSNSKGTGPGRGRRRTNRVARAS
jgi:ATP-dependent RNA helicase RhlE